MKTREKMIGVQVRFWTDDLPKPSKRTCWEHGYVYVPANPARGIGASQVHFNNFLDLLSATQTAMRRAGIRRLPLKAKARAKGRG